MPTISYLSELNLDGETRILRDRLAVSIEASQGLTEEQKANARANIGAGAASYEPITAQEIIDGTGTTGKIVRADYLNDAINSLIDEAVVQVATASY